MKVGMKTLLLVLMCANLPLLLMGQKHEEPDIIELNGVLLTSDSLKPIPDAEIFSKENFMGTFTDSTGNFSLAVVLGDTLLFSSMGYSDRLVAVNDSILALKSPARFFMSLDTLEISEVVIHAYPSYGQLRQKIGNMKSKTQPFDIFNDLKKNPLLYRKPNTGISVEGPVQLLYNLFNAQAVLQRKLIRNRKAYNRHMVRIGRPQDTIPSIPDYMRAKQH